MNQHQWNEFLEEWVTPKRLVITQQSWIKTQVIKKWRAFLEFNRNNIFVSQNREKGYWLCPCRMSLLIKMLIYVEITGRIFLKKSQNCVFLFDLKKKGEIMKLTTNWLEIFNFIISGVTKLVKGMQFWCKYNKLDENHDRKKVFAL